MLNPLVVLAETETHYSAFHRNQIQSAFTVRFGAKTETEIQSTSN